jgi:hypothetical protein
MLSVQGMHGKLEQTPRRVAYDRQKRR